MIFFSKIILIGAGNVATHLGSAFLGAGIQIVQVFSRSMKSASALSSILHSSPVTSLAELRQNADLTVISVPDRYIGEICLQLRMESGMVVHTSGSVPMEILSGTAPETGVLYPVQTFSKNRRVEISGIPFAVESNTNEGLEKLGELVRLISGRPVEMSPEKRAALHLAAVFASNFPNLMYHAAGEILEENGLDFDLLRPLIIETAAKVSEMTPASAQTGPAFRQDHEILAKHLGMLEKNEGFRQIYRLLSEQIIQMKKKR